MAISKEQPLRPAVQEVIDALDTVTDTLLPDALSDIDSQQEQIGEGFDAQNTIANSIATNTNNIAALLNWKNNFRIGISEEFTVQANSTYNHSLTFDTPFAENDEIAVFMCCVNAAENLNTVTPILMYVTQSGFFYAVSNSGASDIDLKLGFLAVKLN